MKSSRFKGINNGKGRMGIGGGGGFCTPHSFYKI